MPDLARVAAEYGDNVGFIGLLTDYNSNSGGARRIAESAGVPQSFIMVDAETKGLEALYSAVTSGYLPTSIIIDGYGHMVTEQLIGSHGEFYGPIFDIILEH